MSSFTLTNTAGDIDSAISRVVGADTTPTAASQNMVTSSGVKSALENLATSNTFTVNSFAPSSIDKLEGGLGASDSTLPTSAAVKDYVLSSAPTMASWQSLTRSTNQLNHLANSGNAQNDGFLIASATGRVSDEDGVISITVANNTFTTNYNRNDSGTVTVPIKKNESYSVVIRNSDQNSARMLFRPLF